MASQVGWPERVQVYDSITLEGLWATLSDINSQIQSAPEISTPGLSLLPHQRMSYQDLVTMRDELRMAIKVRLRPSLRNLTIMDLSTELLIKIFRELEALSGRGFNEFETGDFTKSFRFRPTGIPSVRLTCRLFHDLSSQFLLRHVTVHFDKPSIAKIHHISHHPLIRKGIEHVEVCLDFYDPVLAREQHRFKQSCLSKLSEAHDYFRRQKVAMDKDTREECERCLDKAKPIIDSWNRCIYGIDGKDTWPQYLNAICRRYQFQVEDQQRIYGSGIQLIAAAMARMPSARSLVFREDVGVDGGSGYRDKRIGFRDLGSHILLGTRLVTTTTQKIGFGAQPPIRVLTELPIALHKAGVELRELRIFNFPPDQLSCIPMQPGKRQEFVRAISHLKSLRFDPEIWNDRDHFKTTFGFEHEVFSGRYQPLVQFLTSLLTPKSLEVVVLNCTFMCGKHWGDSFTLGEILPSGKWAGLRHLDFRAPFTSDELARFMEGVGGEKIEVHLEGHLKDGTWAEVLDLLRGRATEVSTVGSRTLYGVHDALLGADWRMLTDEGREHVMQATALNGREYRRADFYVHGKYNTNPFNEAEALGMIREDESEEEEEEEEDGEDNEDDEDEDEGDGEDEEEDEEEDKEEGEEEDEDEEEEEDEE